MSVNSRLINPLQPKLNFTKNFKIKVKSPNQTYLNFMNQ